MAYENKDSGSIFRNDRKREGKKDPDFTGRATIAGQEYWVDMWTQAPTAGRKGFFSIKFRAKDAQRSAGTTHRPERPAPARPGPPPPPPRKQASRDPDLDHEDSDSKMDPNAPDIPWGAPK